MAEIRNNHLECMKPLKIMGKNYQPQLVTVAGFQQFLTPQSAILRIQFFSPKTSASVGQMGPGLSSLSAKGRTYTWPSRLNGDETFWDDEYYLVGKISRSNFFFQGPGRLSERMFHLHI